MIFLTELEKYSSNMQLEEKRSRIAKIIQSKKRNIGGTTVHDCKLYYRAIITKKASYWLKTVMKTQTIPCKYSHLIVDKGAKT